MDSKYVILYQEYQGDDEYVMLDEYMFDTYTETLNYLKEVEGYTLIMDSELDMLEKTEERNGFQIYTTASIEEVWRRN